MRIFLSLVLLLPLLAWANQTVLIYQSKGEKQCEGGGVSLSDSRQKLRNAGVEVIHSKCGYRTGVEIMAVCGASTLKILLHEIKVSDLEKAEDIGMQRAGTLVSKEEGTGYEFRQCPNA